MYTLTTLKEFFSGPSLSHTRSKGSSAFNSFLLLSALLLLSGSTEAAVSNYGFSQSSGTYSTVSTGTTLGSTSSDEQVFISSTSGTTPSGTSVSGTGFSIGFTFNYNGTNYSNFAVSTNGFIVLGNGTFSIAGNSSGFTTPISSSQTTGLVSTISGFGMDLQGQSGSTLRYATIGSSPNRTLVVQWAGFRRYNTSGENINFQIRLNETTNIVEVVYGSYTISGSTVKTAEIGIRGTTNADYNNRLITSGTNTWSTSYDGTANSSTCDLKNTLVPSSGQTYKWNPCTTLPSAPTVSDGTACGLSTVTLSGTAGAGGTAVNWYDALTAGNLLSTSSSYTTSAFTSTSSSTFYAETFDASTGCSSSPRTAVTATSLPTVIFDDGTASVTAPTASQTSVCPGGSSTLSISPARKFVNTPSSAVSIPDNNSTGVSLPLTVSGLSTSINGTTVKIAYVKVNITHSRVGQLSITLIAPDATTCNLSSNNGGNNANYQNTFFRTGAATNVTAGSAPFNGSYAPEQAMSVFNSKNPNGTWTLKVADGTNSTTGTISTWEIAFIDGNGLTYLWSNGSTSVSPTVTPSTTTSYSVTVTAPAGNCQATSGTVTVNAALPTAYNVTGGGSYCTGGSGFAVGLSNSQTGNTYQLLLNGVNSGSPVSGTGSSITFGTQTSAGSYTVVATNTAGGCTNTMNGSATITVNSLPNQFSVTGGGAFCSGGSGVVVGLSGSENGVNYQLKAGASNAGSPVAGTSSSISFGNQTTVATYTVVATNASTSCSATMIGSVSVSTNPLPTAYNVSGGGSYCSGGSGVTVSLSNSTSGFSYQLQLDGVDTGSPVSGTGSSLSFGNQTSAGTYTVIATNPSTGCTNSMNGSAVVTIKPVPTANASATNTLICGSGTTSLSSSGSSNSTSLQTQSVTVNTGIPNVSSAGITSTITISGAPVSMASVTNISVKVNITHGDDQDIEVYLIRPGGTISTSSNGSYFNTISAGGSICLVADAGGSGNNFTNTVFSDAASGTAVATGSAPFTNTYKPENLFSTLTGNPNGTWTIKVLDDANSSSSGTFLNWSLSMDLSDGVTYTWTSSPAGFNSSLQNPGVVSPSVSTNYLVTVANPTNGCSTQASVAVTKDPLLNASCVVTTSESCAGAGDGSITVTASGGTSPYSNDGLFSGLTAGTYSYTVTDDLGCQASCSSTINVVDNVFPTINSCPSNISLNTSGACNAIATWTAPTASDNCAGVTLTSNYNSGDAFPIGTTTVTYTATDASNNVSTCSFTVTVADNENPVITCPANMSVSADAGQCGAVVNFAVSATDNCSATVVSTPASGSFFALGTTTVTSTATDASGNTTCSFDVTVSDNENPVITCPQTCRYRQMQVSAVVVNFAVSATDNCSATVVSTPASGSFFALGTTTVTSTATDASGNTSTCSFDVTVTDNEFCNLRLFSCISAICWLRFYCNMVAPTASDNCGTPT
ncbi:MAG: HYR domain-containing protein [Bacteroidia bacterium]